MKVFYYPGRALGNWNDRRAYRSHDGIPANSRLWRVLDRVASWMYVR